MARPAAKSKVRIKAHSASLELRRQLGNEAKRLRQDANVSQSRVAAASGLSQGYVSMFEAGLLEPTFESAAAVAIALGGTLRAHIEAETGPTIRDRNQARMIETILRALHPRWRRFLEVPLERPVKGVVDLVLFDPDEPALVSGEAQSQLRAFEQQIRWAHIKTEALPRCDLIAQLPPSERPTVAASLLLLRSTKATRRLASSFSSLLSAAYATPSAAIVASLRGSARWPGSGIAWMSVEGSMAKLLDGVPPGVESGR